MNTAKTTERQREREKLRSSIHWSPNAHRSQAEADHSQDPAALSRSAISVSGPWDCHLLPSQLLQQETGSEARQLGLKSELGLFISISLISPFLSPAIKEVELEKETNSARVMASAFLSSRS